MDIRPRAQVDSFFHAESCTFTHVLADPASGVAAIIDPVLDYEARSGRCGFHSAQQLLEFVQRAGYGGRWILETHAHADHLSAAPWLKARLGGRVGIGAGIVAVQRHFKAVFHLEAEFPADGSQFDHLFADGEKFAVGRMQAEVIATPGHTSDSVSFLVGDALFVGDSLFMPDGGSARCDFPGGDAALLYASIQRLYALPGQTRVFVCHDYAPGGRAHACETSIDAQKAGNIHVRSGVSEQQFVAMRQARDAILAMPALIIPAVQVNIRGGEFPPPESNGLRYLKIPLDWC